MLVVFLSKKRAKKKISTELSNKSKSTIW